MLDKVDTEIVLKINTNGGINSVSLSKILNINRTTLLYRLKRLQTLGLITKPVSSSKIITYYLSDTNSIEEYYKKQVNNLEIEKNQIFQSNKNHLLKRGSEKQKIKKQKLVFINYFDLLSQYKQELLEYFDIEDYTDKQLYLNKEEFIYRALNAHVVVNNWALDLTEDIIKQLPKLKYVHQTTLMYRNVDVNALKKRNIHFSNINAPDYRKVALSEYALAQTFALLRKVNSAASQLKSNVFEFRMFKGFQLRGKKATIIGYDEVSADFINLIKNLGVEVTVFTTDKSVSATEIGVKVSYEINDALIDTDIIYFLNSSDKEFKYSDSLDNKVLGNINKPVFIVSIAKHKSIDTGLLRKLIIEGKVLGVALDYFSEITQIKDIRESKIHEIAFLPNVLITPDIAWNTVESTQKLNEITTKCLIAYATNDFNYLLF